MDLRYKRGFRPLLSLMAVCLSVATAACGTTRIEEPAYKRVMQEKSFEIREYTPRLVAQTTVSGTQKEAGNKAFRVLADYIFGNNTAQSSIDMTSPVTQQKNSQKIAMTAPVSQSRLGATLDSEGSSSEGEWIVQFTMPDEFTMDTLPTPNNPAVDLVELPPARYAVLRFSGRVNDSLVATKTIELDKFVSANSLSVAGGPVLAQYNPPWTLGPMRRNEILVPLLNE